MIDFRHLALSTLLGSALLVGVSLAGPASAQLVAQPQAVVPDADKSPRVDPAPSPCTDCRGGEAGRPASSDTITTTPDGKTTVPRTVIREQADFRLNDALRNVPGVTRR